MGYDEPHNLYDNILRGIREKHFILRNVNINC